LEEEEIGYDRGYEIDRGRNGGNERT